LHGSFGRTDRLLRSVANPIEPSASVMFASMLAALVDRQNQPGPYLMKAPDYRTRVPVAAPDLCAADAHAMHCCAAFRRAGLNLESRAPS